MLGNHEIIKRSDQRDKRNDAAQDHQDQGSAEDRSVCALVPLPVCLLLLMCFCMGLGMMLSALAVFFRDVMHLWSVVITAWMYLTPIFWTTDFIGQMARWIQVLVVVNPMYNYLQFMRDIFLFNTVPSALTFGLCVVWAVLALAIGYTVFHKTEHKFILYI